MEYYFDHEKPRQEEDWIAKNFARNAFVKSERKQVKKKLTALYADPIVQRYSRKAAAVVAPYSELFADTVAVLFFGDPEVITKSTKPYGGWIDKQQRDERKFSPRIEPALLAASRSKSSLGNKSLSAVNIRSPV